MPTKLSSSTNASAEQSLDVQQQGLVLDGKEIAADIRCQVRSGVERLLLEHRVRPGLAVIMVGDDASSRLYVNTKERACEQVGISCRVHRLGSDVSEDELVHLIYRLNRDRETHGILIQLPLPERALENPAIAELAPEKDVDGLSPINQAHLLAGERGFRPCTPLGVMELIDRAGIDLAGRRAVVVGTSALVGKPLALMLLERNATVVLCHEFTRDLPAEVAGAEVLVSAVGRVELIRGEWIRPGATVIDVGINRTATGVRGDVEFEAARERAGFITPVPGGVGPMTVAMLLRNTLTAAEQLAVRVR
ncbi:MAG TPA: bifunctional 5,10-methylenetetrahydrofolate dehydrogenase/5,10-methenyltetrahydrofolate cyclohydrolase [Candidatus Binataceae bacterium]|nr:bifunctional 5,10-methylenetetrahydrofolate dehydrogenase/5,10-methenyltetrahydrofolate cyclohydrolase [Candidatus Binataceae bacterium]